MSVFWKAFLDSAVLIVGGNALILLLIFGIMCSFAALLALASESRALYHRASRCVGVLVLVFGILLPFRGPVYRLGTALCVGWTVILFHAVPRAEFVQGVAAVVLNIIFWASNARSESSLVQVCGDFAVFVILSSVFTIVYLSRGFDLLGERPKTGGPVIPLQKLIARSAALLGQVIPPEP
jgi:hypothetical protein